MIAIYIYYVFFITPADLHVPYVGWSSGDETSVSFCSPLPAGNVLSLTVHDVPASEVQGTANFMVAITPTDAR